jgi:FkbM family methyltransferase
MKIHKKIIRIVLSVVTFLCLFFWVYPNRRLIRFAVTNRAPWVFWTKKLESNGDALKLIKPMLPDNPVIIEAGACDGSDTVRLAKTWPNGHIFAFEPVPELYKKVEAITKGFLNISTFPLALSDKEGSADFFISSKDIEPNKPSASSSLLAPGKHFEKCPDIHFKEKITVSTNTLDLWAQKNNIDHVDFIWLDTQGSELMILQNATSILKTVKYVLTEVEFVEAYKNQPLFEEVKKWMESQGFTLEAFHVACSWYGDALFVKQK